MSGRPRLGLICRTAGTGQMRADGGMSMKGLCLIGVYLGLDIMPLFVVVASASKPYLTLYMTAQCSKWETSV